ncbi:hypothetical protein [Streptomyces sp. NPDC087437]|uniref:hypothetical protein n=1 Tax=Streptomyces sp. NPDC087437 TaxID=3365789 RepID=UPI003826BC72
MTRSSSHLDATADAYRAVSVRYADLFRDALDALPLDPAVIGAFAEPARTSGQSGGSARHGHRPSRPGAPRDAGAGRPAAGCSRTSTRASPP